MIANDTEAEGVAGVDRNCSVIRPHAGHLIFFDARRYPHYARVLTADSETRIVAVMNFYTESCRIDPPPGTKQASLRRQLETLAPLRNYGPIVTSNLICRGICK